MGRTNEQTYAFLELLVELKKDTIDKVGMDMDTYSTFLCLALWYLELLLEHSEEILEATQSEAIVKYKDMLLCTKYFCHVKLELEAFYYTNFQSH